ncbi:psbQ-like protein 3, chloroplastic isoform X1 [Abrus precatorius]|uniref:PsbQ-like protein 3, chloroplastic isoform X1 n=1 Tax=Abrus precatorius TaxID=3816 RepID=A0A8B8KNZ7_ABRPR|nr:psbQ-like protein 3, chloroplastic isoform X1 [Abrus precatorius]XP_027344452.1 psbQ-like protein 3, chloroplastic isoform X1 [Abrus precatorius]XP_027344453.1 psbQ-like protein 3, chloroplastic isoform X1 [Abrus precatorius]XP_027344454.1 psbQ-like protein 3, chloroplastic isoform X1 [Abrus precatorius]XP_027344455.1 psbQ-like protein 3, chloroplastic isoform X1 [Abrus precatorius]XP_027344456.1 psbQ-like protein 3, chloroplastic isoform X1 [Abrus precatorius]
MELRSLTLQPNLTQLLPTLTCCVKPSFQHLHQKELSLKISRRLVALAAVTSLILGGEGNFMTQSANAFDFRFVAPGQTIEEALSGVKDHAQDLLQVRELLESESWKAAQKTLRQSSALLKKDIYTIIQNKPGIERPPLRKLYSTLFNNVTRLDYAARDKDGPQVWQCYENIVVAVYDILSRI